jgi:hypothetical protein
MGGCVVACLAEWGLGCGCEHRPFFGSDAEVVGCGAVFALVFDLVLGSLVWGELEWTCKCWLVPVFWFRYNMYWT